MTKEFNVLELASELADKKVKEVLIGEPVYEETEDETHYTEEAQDYFNELYDEYYDFLINL